MSSAKIIIGNLLIAEPSSVYDQPFNRSIVLLTEYNEEGTVGFIINKPLDYSINDLIPTIIAEFSVFYGVPVSPDNVYFIHNVPEIISDGIEIAPGIFWGGDFETVLTLLNANALKTNEIKFFIGYSGWSEGQLEAEIETKSWITRQSTNELIFDTKAEQIWKNALKDLDGEYKQMIHYPLDPQIN